MKIVKSPGERLRELMENLNISQAEVCRRTGITKSAISRYLLNEREMKLDKAKIIAQTFDVNPAWIMGFDVDSAPFEDGKCTVMESYIPDTEQGQLILDIQNKLKEMSAQKLREIKRYIEFLMQGNEEEGD